MGLIRDILHSLPATDGRPLEAAAYRSHEIPGVEGVHERFLPEAAALVGGLGVRHEAGGGFGGDDGGASNVVDLPGEGPEVEECENGHFDT